MAGAAQTAEPKPKSSAIPLILGLMLGLAGAGGGFFAAYSGFFGFFGQENPTSHSPIGSEAAAEAHTDSGRAPAPRPPSGENMTFLPLDPITVNVGPAGQSRHLRFSAQLEVPAAQAAAVQHLMPRILDVINIYLRALAPHEIEEPAALVRLRAQMLRRIRMVAGPEAVNDLLIIGFVFN